MYCLAGFCVDCMFRGPITTDPKKARRAFIILVLPNLMTTPLVVWAVILREWLILAIWAVAEAEVIAMMRNYYIVGWPGSRIESYRAPLRLRLSHLQQLVAGLTLVIATLLAWLVLGQGRNELILALIGLTVAVGLFRFVRLMRKEGRGKRHHKS
jgi:hypothetical protein